MQVKTRKRGENRRELTRIKSLPSKGSDNF